MHYINTVYGVGVYLFIEHVLKAAAGIRMRADLH